MKRVDGISRLVFQGKRNSGIRSGELFLVTARSHDIGEKTRISGE